MTLGSNFDSYYDPPEYDEPKPVRCHCGAFLPAKPDRTEPWEDTTACDGAATAVVVTPDASLAAIVGPEPYTEHWAACGNVGGHHPPHIVVNAAGNTAIWTCRRGGHEHKETW